MLRRTQIGIFRRVYTLFFYLVPGAAGIVFALPASGLVDPLIFLLSVSQMMVEVSVNEPLELPSCETLLFAGPYLYLSMSSGK